MRHNELGLGAIWAELFPIPRGIAPSSPGLRAASYPGKQRRQNPPNLKEVAPLWQIGVLFNGSHYEFEFRRAVQLRAKRLFIWTAAAARSLTHFAR
jgi:hypothetical protein